MTLLSNTVLRVGMHIALKRLGFDYITLQFFLDCSPYLCADNANKESRKGFNRKQKMVQIMRG